MPDQRFAAVAELERIGDRDDLHDARVLQALHATAHGRFGESDLFGDRSIGATTVVLQAVDDLAVERIERPGCRVDELDVYAIVTRLTLSLCFGCWHCCFLSERPYDFGAADCISIGGFGDGKRRNFDLGVLIPSLSVAKALCRLAEWLWVSAIGQRPSRGVLCVVWPISSGANPWRQRAARTSNSSILRRASPSPRCPSRTRRTSTLPSASPRRRSRRGSARRPRSARARC